MERDQLIDTKKKLEQRAQSKNVVIEHNLMTNRAKFQAQI